METTHPAESTFPSESPSGAPRGIFPDAVGFWEPRRVIYNLALTAVVVYSVVATWPHFRPALTLASLRIMAVLALLANVCYCAAYLVDIPAQHLALSAVWNRRRWILWLTGMLLAILFTNYWIADEIYPFVQ